MTPGALLAFASILIVVGTLPSYSHVGGNRIHLAKQGDREAVLQKACASFQGLKLNA